MVCDDSRYMGAGVYGDTNFALFARKRFHSEIPRLLSVSCWTSCNKAGDQARARLKSL